MENISTLIQSGESIETIASYEVESEKTFDVLNLIACEARMGLQFTQNLLEKI